MRPDRGRVAHSSFFWLEWAISRSPKQDQEEMAATPTTHDLQLCGSVLVLIQFDVCEEIRLDRMREIFSAQTVQKPPLKHALPNYVRYQRPPSSKRQKRSSSKPANDFRARLSITTTAS